MSGQKLSCRQVETRLTAYLKNELPAGQEEALRQHLLGCSACTDMLEEAQRLDVELRLEARRVRHSLAPLSANSSLEIQEKLYRRMRRALFWQRMLEATQRLGALTTLLLFLLFAALIFGPWRQQLVTLSDGTSEAMLVPEEPESAADAPAATTALQIELATPEPEPEPAATPTPETEIRLVEESAPTPAVAATPIVAREQPLEAAQRMLGVALSGNNAELASLLEQAQPLPSASYRVWQRLGRCQGQVDAGQFAYREVIHGGNFASIYVLEDGLYVGDIKMRLHREGFWFVAAVNYASFATLSYRCAR